MLASGEVMRVGARTVKTSSGYDLCKMLVGSEGTLAVITEITLKISSKKQLCTRYNELAVW